MQNGKKSRKYFSWCAEISKYYLWKEKIFGEISLDASIKILFSIRILFVSKINDQIFIFILER
jgi:hypothetical protein